MCAGKLAWGALNTNACPAGSSVISDEAQCQAAAATAGKGWYGSASVSTDPRGCAWYTAGYGVALNTHPTGAANPDTQPLCAVGTGALSRALALARSARLRACPRARHVS